MTTFPAPIARWAHPDDQSLPLVILLHGRGSNESEILSLATHLPDNASYVALRAPIAENGGFAWFANRGIGRPVPESLLATVSWGLEWIDGVAASARPVILIGFSGGAAYAGGLILDDPARFSGAAILYGTLPFEAGVPTTTGRLAGMPVLAIQGLQDTVIPAELLERTREYLSGDSEAIADVVELPGGHGISAEGLDRLQHWLATRLQSTTTAS